VRVAIGRLRGSDQLWFAGRLLLSLLALAIGWFLWDAIRLPYANPHDIVGILSENYFHPANNVVRFAVFILLPSAVWFLLGFLPIRAWTAPVPVPEAADRGRLILGAALGTGLIIAIGSGIRRLTGSLAWFYLDLFHDGDQLAPLLVWAQRGGLWSGNYLTRGALADVLMPWFAWRISGSESIGAAKASGYLADALVPVAIWLFVFMLQGALKNTATAGERAILVWVTLSILYVVQPEHAWFQIRTIPMLLAAGALAVAFGRDRPAWFFVAGAVSLLALFTSSDAGVYSIAASVVAIAVFLPGRLWRRGLERQMLPWIGGLLSGSALLLVIFGLQECLAWIRQIGSTASRWDYIYSYPYPSPSFGETWAHTWPMLVIAVVVLGFASRLPLYWQTDERMRAHGRIHLLLTALSVICYRTALGRSDGAHLAQGMTFAFIGIAFTFWIWIGAVPSRFRKVLAAGAALPLLWAFVSFTADGTWVRIASLPSEVRSYWRAPDSRFLSPEQQAAAAALAPIFVREPCLFVFPNEPGWYYLLRTRPCSRFHFTVHAAGADHQQELVQTLDRVRPEYILYSTPFAATDVDGISNHDRLWLVNAWILRSYEPFRTVEGWVVVRRRSTKL
jgi:hypothetical protein